MPRIKANGLEFEYETFGRADDPAILLIKGFAAQMTLWPVALCEGLAAQGFHVIRFDNRDVGKTTHLSHFGMPNISEAMGKAMAGEAVNPPYTLDDMAMDAASLLDALEIADAHIVGASMGGMIAQLWRSITRKKRAVLSRSCRRRRGAIAAGKARGHGRADGPTRERRARGSHRARHQKLARYRQSRLSRDRCGTRRHGRP